MADPARATSRHKGEGHRRRLRERFLAGGLAGFHDYEVIELLLTLATPRRDCKEAAKAAIARFGTLPAVLEAPAEELQTVSGIGPTNLFGIKLAKALVERYLEGKLIGAPVIGDSRALRDYLDGAIRDRSRECFLAVYLDAKNRVIAQETLFEGTLNASAVYPREVILAALRRGAAALIFAHNHPSGDPRPSVEDLEITRRLVYAADLMGITVHEHLIIGKGRVFSFADEGHIARIRAELARSPAHAAAAAARSR